jgi:hypothetical protein
MIDKEKPNRDYDRILICERYEEILLEVGSYTVRRRDDGIGNSYRAMIGHECPQMDRYHLRNGEWRPQCHACGELVPDEIWGLWNLICNDQRYGDDPWR